MSLAAPPQREIGRIRRLIKRGRERASQIAAWNKRRRRRIAQLEALIAHQEAVPMFDSIEVSAIPLSAPAVAGYVGGNWPTYQRLAERFPAPTLKVPIAVNSAEPGLVLDVEPGDATNGAAVLWHRRRRSEGAKRLGLYTSVSNVEPLIAALAAAGIPWGSYELWSAHYTFAPHICGPHTCAYPGLRHSVGATQWTDRALGRNLDQSLARRSFLAAVGRS